MLPWRLMGGLPLYAQVGAGIHRLAAVPEVGSSAASGARGRSFRKLTQEREAQHFPLVDHPPGTGRLAVFIELHEAPVTRDP